MDQIAVLVVLLASSCAINASLGTWVVTGRLATASTSSLQRLALSGGALVATFTMIFVVVQAYR